MLPGAEIALHLGALRNQAETVSTAAQCKLAQCAEHIRPDGCAGQIFRFSVDQHNTVGAVKHGIGDSLARGCAGDGGDGIAQALDVLYAEGGIHVNAGSQQLSHVLMALGMAAACRVGVSQMIDQKELRPAGECCVEIQLARSSLRGGQNLQPLKQ